MVSRSLNYTQADRGVSEIVGFVLSFSIIIVSVGLLMTAGFGSLNDLQGNQQTDNAEQVFLAMSEGLADLEEGHAPARTGLIELQGKAFLKLANGSEINVTVNGPDFNRTIETNSIQYQFRGTTIAYESGAVFRERNDNSAMVSGPPEFYCSNSSNVAVISLVELTAPTQSSISGGTVSIATTKRATTLLYPTTRTGSAIDNVTVDVDSPYTTAWNRHFSDENTGWVEKPATGAAVCEDVNRVFVRHSVIEIRFAG